MKRNVALLMVLVGVTLVAVSFSLPTQLAIGGYANTGAWFEAPPGYEITQGGVMFCEQYFYNDKDEVLGFRWLLKAVDTHGYGYEFTVEALPPMDGYWYEWSPFPYGWVAVGDKIGYLTMRYGPVTNEQVWVYAPLQLVQGEPPSLPTPSPTPYVPAPTPSPSSPPVGGVDPDFPAPIGEVGGGIPLQLLVQVAGVGCAFVGGFSYVRKRGS